MFNSSKPKSCKNCGVCCTWEVPIYPEDKDNIPEDMVEIIKIPEEYKAMRRHRGSNVYIAFDLKTKKCTIYKKKPIACREFEMGGHDCLMARNFDSIYTYQIKN